MKTLYVLYDGECSLCRRCRDWLMRQPAYVALQFVAYQEVQQEPRFQGVEALHPDQEMVVISDSGDIWQGAAAWITCLWALRAYRDWACRLATPALQPLARRFVKGISRNRRTFSSWLPASANTCENGRCMVK